MYTYIYELMCKFIFILIYFISLYYIPIQAIIWEWIVFLICLNRVSYSFSTTNNSFTKMTRCRCWALTWAMASPLPSRRTAWNGYRMTCALDKWWCSSSICLYIISRYVLQMVSGLFWDLGKHVSVNLGVTKFLIEILPLLKDSWCDWLIQPIII